MEKIRVDGLDNIYLVEGFEEEFDKITNNEERYKIWLTKSLAQLDVLGKEALKLPGFEKLKKISPNIYSIRYPKSIINPRVLYIYFEGKKVILLKTFKEKKKSDYTKNIKIAKNIINKLND